MIGAAGSGGRAYHHGNLREALVEAGWYPDRQPGGLHFMLSPFHAKVADDLLAGLAAAVAVVREGRTSDRAAATYGSAGPSGTQSAAQSGAQA